MGTFLFWLSIDTSGLLQKENGFGQKLSQHCQTKICYYLKSGIRLLLK